MMRERRVDFWLGKVVKLVVMFGLCVMPVLSFAQTPLVNDGPIDFKADTETAKKWGKEQKKIFEDKLSNQEKKALDSFMNDHEKVNSEFLQLNLLDQKQLNPKQQTTLKELDKALEKANVPKSVITYQTGSAENIGFNGRLYWNGEPLPAERTKFINQFTNKNMPLDSYLSTTLTINPLKSEEDIIFKITVPQGGKGSVYPKVKGSIWLNKKSEHELILDHSHELHVTKIKEIVIKGKKCLQLEADLQEIKDFKNDINGKGAAWGEKYYQQWADGLDDIRDKALADYLLLNGEAVNQYLRSGGQGNASLDRQVSDIAAAVSQYPIPENVVLYRRTDSAEFGVNPSQDLSIEALDKLLVNQVFQQKAFISTSLSSEPKSFSRQKYILRLIAPKGTQGAYISALKDVIKTEKEMLINKDQRYKVQSIKEISIKGDYKYLVDAVLLNDNR